MRRPVDMHDDSLPPESAGAPRSVGADRPIARRTPSASPVILVVDDEPFVRQSMVAMLDLAGWTPIEAATGTEAIALASSVTPDLVLLDIGLPDQDGFAVCRALRSLHGFGEVPILMVTGRGDAAAIRGAFEAGATDFVNKTMTPALIVHRIRFMLRAATTIRALRRSEARLADAQRIAHMGHWEFDLSTEEFTGSLEARRLLGIPESRKSLPLQEALAALADADRDRLATQLLHSPTVASDRFDDEFRITQPDGVSRVVRVIGETETDAFGLPLRVVGTAQDLTDLAASRDEIRTLAYYDSLTNLPNRLLFRDRASASLARARRRGTMTAVLAVDLDHFKQINDSLGHDAGDEVLRFVAGRLTSALRSGDEASRDDSEARTVARIGGDEFLVAVDDLAEPAEAAAVARRLLQAIAAPISLSSGPVHIAASIGISVAPDDGDALDELLKHADVALYQAKRDGGNRMAFFDSAMTALAAEKAHLESGLRDAIASHRIELRLQPRVDAESGQLIGTDAAAAWRDATLGVVAEANVHRAAEHSELAVTLAATLVSLACQTLCAWQASHRFVVPIRIPLSRLVLRNPQSTRLLCATPQACGLDPRLIEFAFPERALSEEPRSARGTLQHLAAHGHPLVMTDWGASATRLADLAELPLSGVTIASLLVPSGGHDDRSAALLRGLVTLARTLSLEVSADGVSTPHQRDMLRDVGCARQLGPLFGHASEANTVGDRLPRYLRRRRLLPSLEAR